MASPYDELTREELIGLVQDQLRPEGRVEHPVAREAFRQSEERFRSLTAAAFEGIGISENGKVVDVNDQLMRMLGYTREEIVGHPVLVMVAPESRAAVEQAIRSGQE